MRGRNQHALPLSRYSRRLPIQQSSKPLREAELMSGVISESSAMLRHRMISQVTISKLLQICFIYKSAVTDEPSCGMDFDWETKSFR